MQAPDNIDKLIKALKNINNLQTDYLAEFIVAHLLENKISLDNIRIVRMGRTRSKVAKDIESIETGFTLDGIFEKYIKISVNREGLFDILPENIFSHNNRNINHLAKTEDLLSEIRENRIKKENIRSFFSLFENEIDSLRTQVQLWEYHFHDSHKHRNLMDMFNNEWPIMSDLSPEEGFIFIHILSIVHEIRGNISSTEQAISAILNISVKIIPLKISHSPLITNELDKCQLDDACMLNDEFVDDQEDFILQVNGIPQNRIAEFLPKGKGTKIIDEMISLLFQADAIVNKQFNSAFSATNLTLDSSDDMSAFLEINVIF